MLSYEQAMKDQEDLPALLAPKRPRTREIYWGNANYGFARVLKEYAGYPIMRPIQGIYPHGVYFGTEKLFPGERDAPVPAVFSYPEFIDRLWREESDKVVFPSASPFLYGLALMEDVPLPPKREGTVFFAAHSTAKCRVVSAPEKVMALLDSLPDEYQPITVCAHWFDYSIGLHKPYEEHGYRVVSAGHFGDDQFLFRLIHILRSHRVGCTNSLGSTVFYATIMGLPFFVLDAPPKVTVDPDFAAERGQRSTSSERVDMKEAITEIYRTPSLEVNEDQVKISRYMLGADRLKSPEELHTELKKAEFLALRGAAAR